MSASFESRLKAQALGLGFDLAGIATLGHVETHRRFENWLAAGEHGTMDYLSRGAELRSNTTLPEPGMRSALVVALDYGGRSPDGPVARYARGTDYHRVMWDRLEAMLDWVHAERRDTVRGRAYVDTGPVLERDLARKAGLGWFGKNSMLIHPEKGSFFFLGALFLDCDLTPDAPFVEEHCGTCTRCLEACPTGAIVAPGRVDARRCISYLTIEHRGEITPELEPLVGEHVYGCDICQDVCPWNVKFASEVREPAFAARAPVAAGDVLQDVRVLAREILAMDAATYRASFKHSAMKRAKLDGLKRNARTVLKNLGLGALLAALVAALVAVLGTADLAAQTAPRPDSTRVDSLRPVVVSATRGRRRVEDEPLRVETLGKEEVEEKLLMTPGDITMMLNETSGLRVQTTSPGLGGANVRIQGLRGRYTQILVDGLPLHGAQTGGLGLLQIPPMDLGGVEVIKGVSSALYGGSALGGVVNLISRRPQRERTTELLLNRTSLGGADAVAFTGEQWNARWGYTLLVGGHQQRRIDRDDDGWTDLPSYERFVVRPRLHWRSPRGHSAMLTVGATSESRVGGTEPGAVTADATPFPERLRSARSDAGVVAQWLVGPVIVAARGAISSQGHQHTFGPTLERDDHLTSFGEVAVNGVGAGGVWVVGAAWQQERYRAEHVSGFDYAFTTPGFFAQHTVDVHPRMSISASARADLHSEYGTQFSPRLSALWRARPQWWVRASLGGGYFAPTPFTEEVEVVGLSQVIPLNGLRVERAQSGSLDIGGSRGDWEFHFSLFGTRINDPVQSRESTADSLAIVVANADGPVSTLGAELMLRRQFGPVHVSGSYTLLRAHEADVVTGAQIRSPLTPAGTVGAIAMWEEEEVGRAGLEIYHTGAQRLLDDPSDDAGRPYTHIGVLIERNVGSLRVFLNAENLLDVRQTRTTPLLRTARGLGGRWTTDVWAPLDGRVFNVGVRF